MKSTYMAHTIRTEYFFSSSNNAGDTNLKSSYRINGEAQQPEVYRRGDMSHKLAG